MPSQELNEAAKVGDAALIQELLARLKQQEQEVWLRDSILRATYENRTGTVRALLKCRSQPTSTDSLGQSTLHWAARQGYEELSKILLAARAPVGIIDHEGATPLHFAAQTNSGAVVDLLLSRRAHPAAKQNDKRTPLHLAAESGSAVSVGVIMSGKMEDIGLYPAGKEPGVKYLDLENDKGETPLGRAASRGHSAIVQMLLKSRADAGHKNWWGQSVLHLASHGGHVGCAAVLLEYAADVHAVAQDWTTSLHIAVDRGNSQVAELLLSHGANVKAVSSGGRTPLHAAAEKGCIEATDALVAHGGEVNARTDEQRTPLSFAAARGHAAVVRKLIDSKADLQVVDNVGQTPLHSAAALGRIEAGDTLIGSRARLELRDNAGRTPMMLALEANSESMVRLLLKRGAALPEDKANAEEFQPIIREVESETLQEQIREAEDGRTKAELKKAEHEFEQARLKLLKLTGLDASAFATPCVHNAEMDLSEATDLARAAKAAEDNLANQVKVISDAWIKTTKESDYQSSELEKSRKAINDMREAHGTLSKELITIRRDITEARAGAKASKSRDASLTAAVEEALSRAEHLDGQLANLVEEGDGLRKELEEVRTHLAKWHTEKEEAAMLHTKAHALLTRPEVEQKSSAAT